MINSVSKEEQHVFSFFLFAISFRLTQQVVNSFTKGQKKLTSLFLVAIIFRLIQQSGISVIKGQQDVFSVFLFAISFRLNQQVVNSVTKGQKNVTAFFLLLFKYLRGLFHSSSFLSGASARFLVFLTKEFLSFPGISSSEKLNHASWLFGQSGKVAVGQGRLYGRRLRRDSRCWQLCGRVLKWQPKALVKLHIVVTINASFRGQGNKATCLLLWKIYLVANRSFLTFCVF